MDVVHINDSDGKGGAAQAAFRLHRALQEEGIASRFLVRHKSSQDMSVEVLTPERLDPAIHQRTEAIQRCYNDHYRTALSNTHFSVSLLGHDLSKHPAIAGADLIHLHWVPSLLTPTTLRQLLTLNKPVVWTLHDLAAFTGGCHYPAGCSGFQEACCGCPQLLSDPFDLPARVLKDKKALLSTKDLTLIAPSRWMAGQARASALFRSGPRLAVLPYGVDIRVFHPHPQAQARAALGVPQKGRYVLCGADFTQETRKGFGPLARILNRCQADVRFRAMEGGVLAAGDKPPAWAGVDAPVHFLGRLTTEEQMALAYAAADVFVLPSLEDNLPNMMLESLSCGTPVAAFAVGGVPDVIQDGRQGRLVPLGDEQALAEALLSLLSDPQRCETFGREGRALIERDYSFSVLADRHRELYQSVLAEKGAGVRALPPGLSINVPMIGDPGPSVSAILADMTLHCLTDEVQCQRQQYQASEADRRAQLRVIEDLQDHWRWDRENNEGLRQQLQASEADRRAQLQVIESLHEHSRRDKENYDGLRQQLQACEADRRAQLQAIEDLQDHRRRDGENIEGLGQQLQASEADRRVQTQVIKYLQDHWRRDKDDYERPLRRFAWLVAADRRLGRAWKALLAMFRGSGQEIVSR